MKTENDTGEKEKDTLQFKHHARVLSISMLVLFYFHNILKFPLKKHISVASGFLISMTCICVHTWRRDHAQPFVSRFFFSQSNQTILKHESMLSIAVWNICTETNIYSDHNCNTYHFMKTVMLSANFKYKWEWNAQRNKPVTCWIYQTIKVGNNGFPALIKKSRLNQELHDNGTYKYKHKQFAADFKLEEVGS